MFFNILTWIFKQIIFIKLLKINLAMGYDYLKIEEPKNLKDIGSLLKRDLAFDSGIISDVSKIIEDIKNSGDKALFSYCAKFDGINAESVNDIMVPKDEIAHARAEVAAGYPELVEAVNIAYKNLVEYHSAQFEKEPKTWFIESIQGRRLGQISSPISRAGLYIPGGRYIYPSSVLMTAVPAAIAGVKDIAVCTPPQKDGKINKVLLYLFSFLNISEVYMLGGAQAIAALAYGTETIKRVEKIAGPGNIYVTTAKKLVYGSVGIDSLAGPSEVLIIADESADGAFVASDLLSQSEHDPDAKSILLTTDQNLASETITQVYRQLDLLYETYPNSFNRDMVIRSLKKNCNIFLNPDMDFLIDSCNLIAPEHLEIMAKDYDKVLYGIKNAGAIFLGNYTPVAVGDYICGTNHVIPTGGNSRFSSPLGVYDFCKKSSVAYYNKEYLRKERKYIEILSEFENLLAHNNSVKIRFGEDKY
jgi:histidinol dehydrogenase